jgi:hypothetical protein
MAGAKEGTMTRFLLLVNFDNGDVEEPMTSWDPADIRAHMAYYEALNKELEESGELVGGAALAWPEAARRLARRPTVTPVTSVTPVRHADRASGLTNAVLANFS